MSDVPFYFYDEMRYGIRTILGRAWTPKGLRPSGKMRIGYQYRYLFLALSPLSGDVFALLMPAMDSKCYEVFLQKFAVHLKSQGLYDDQKPALRFISDNARSHHSDEVIIPIGLLHEHIPPYSPELNPCERFFEEVRRSMKNRVLESLDEIEDIIIAKLNDFWKKPEAVVKLCYWDWMMASDFYANS